MEIYLARTQGFCSGVSYAIEIVEQALIKYGTPLYVYHEIVHNRSIVDDFKKRGVIFVNDLKDVPEKAYVIFSAHGVPPTIIESAKLRNLHYIDATCPLVAKVHNKAAKYSNENIDVVLIGHQKHQELIGTAGYVRPDLLHIIKDSKGVKKIDVSPEKKISYLTQTTLSVDDTKEIIDALRLKFEQLISPPDADICYATQNRQDAVKELAKVSDLVIIVGSPNSSNSNRLRETALALGTECVMIDTADELDVVLLDNKQKIGISSGASVPQYLVDALVDKIQQHYSKIKVNTFENPEKNIKFKIPEI